MIALSLLSEINQTLEKVNHLKAQVDAKKQEIELLKEKNEKDQEAFKQTQMEVAIQNKILDQFSTMQKKFQEIEQKIRQTAAVKIEELINSYLTSENLNKLITKIKVANNNLEPVVSADPKIANKLSITKFESSREGLLRLTFGDYKTYILDIEDLREKLRKELFILYFAN